MVELKRDSKATSPMWIITVTDKEGFHKQLQISRDDMNYRVELWERRREELMKLSKEELVELIIGKREQVGMIIG